MSNYLDQLDAAEPAKRWKMARGFVFGDPFPFFAELREHRPVYALPEVTLVSRYTDCNQILRKPHAFGVDLYKPKQGGYFMSHDDTAKHWRDKAIMKAILDVEDIPKIRDWVRDATDRALDQAGGDIELVRAITRGVPAEMVQEWFGFTRADPDKLIEWSYWNQQDAFWNQPFDCVVDGLDQPGIVRKRERASFMMALYLSRLIARRTASVKLGSQRQDTVSRLLRLSFSGGVEFGVRDVIQNVGGLLIGAVETTSHTVCNALTALMADDNLLAEARKAALEDRREDFDGYVFEALRFNPAFPYFFRVCNRDTVLAGDTPHQTTVKKGTTVLAVTHSAMFDPQAFPNPESFLATRDLSDTFTFGYGIHSCLGRHIAAVMVPEIVRQVLRRSGLNAGTGPDFQGSSVPQNWRMQYSI